MIMVDTNVLVYALNADSPQHAISRTMVEAARNRKLHAIIVPQIIMEFMAVVTDRRRVENPLSPATALQQVEAIRAIFRVLDPGPAALDRFLETVQEKEVKGPGVFDAWLAAQAKALGVSTVCTYNTADFSGLPVTAQTPQQILDASLDS